VRLLFWSEFFWPYIGGAEVWGPRLAVALRERGYEILVVTSHDYLELPDKSEHEGLRVHRFPFRAALQRKNIEQVINARRRLVDLKLNFSPDLVHIHNIGPSAVFHLHTIDSAPAPFSVTMRQQIMPGQTAGRDSIQGQILRAADWVVGCSAATLEQGRQWAPEIIPRSSVIFNAPDAPSLPPAPLPVEHPRVLYLGRLIPQKGVDVALRAFASVVEHFPRARLIIAGEGVERQSLEQQVVALGLTDVVEFLGWVAPEAVPAIMNSATVVIIPSWREGLPWVAMEAAQMARPIVATSVGGLPDVIQDQNTGLLVEPGNSGAIRDAILSLLNDPEKARQMGRNARRRAQDAFSWAAYVDAYDQLFQRLVKTRSTADYTAGSQPRI
jgi:glycogen(starch) synthase